MAPKTDQFLPKKEPLYLDTVPELIFPEESKFRMVGTGSKCENSGQTIAMVCPGCGKEVSTRYSTCGHVECPSCWSTWAVRGSERIAPRIWGYREASGTTMVPRHITFEVESFDKKQLKKKMKDLGITGGVCIPHPWRIKPEYRQFAAEEAGRTGKNRYTALRDSEVGMAGFRWSPHVHVLCYGKLIEVAAGSKHYLYHMLGRCNTLQDVERRSFYLLSHTMVPDSPQKKTYFYFGCCSTKNLQATWKGKVSDLLRCPHCGQALVYPGSNTCKVVTKYATSGWFLVVKIPKKKPPGLVVQQKPVELVTQSGPLSAWTL